jgi:hypothetical protein
MPDWLKADAEEDEDGIFAPAEQDREMQAVSQVMPDGEQKSITEELAVDTSDPWVEAFELERTEGMADINTIPDWYAERLEGTGVPQPVASVSASAPVSPATLAEASLLPETELQPGEPEALPDWLAAGTLEIAEVSEATPAEMPDWLKEQMPVAETSAALSEELPDWLKEAEVVPAEEVPDWLKDTLSTDEHIAILEPPPPSISPMRPPVPATVTDPFASPVPVPAVARIDVAAALASARTKLSDGDVDASLTDYEAVVRANAELDAVATDLSKLIDDKKHKENPAIYRVLGDSLMRQGKLQAALDTYRKALNLL